MSLGGGLNTDGSNAGGIYVQFNQDCTSLVAGSSSGYHLFALTPDDGVEEIYASRSGQDTCLVDRLFSSSLVAIVTVAAPRKLIVCHYKKGTEICNYSYSNTILAVKLNRSVTADRVPGGVAAHPQHPRHEDPAHDPRHAAQPARAVRALAGRGALLRGVPGQQRGGRGADLRRRAPERQVRAERARQPAGGARLVHVRAPARDRLGARDRHPRVRGAGAHAPLRVPARREALRQHRLPRVQRVRAAAGGHLQHGDRARVPAVRGGARRARARRVAGLAVAGGDRERGLPARRGGGRAGAGPRVRRRAPARQRPPSSGRHHQCKGLVRRRGRGRGRGRCGRAAAGGDERGRAVRVRAGGRGRRVHAAAHAPPARGRRARGPRARRFGAGAGAGRGGERLPAARRLRPARPAALPTDARAAPRGAGGRRGGRGGPRRPRGRPRRRRRLGALWAVRSLALYFTST